MSNSTTQAAPQAQATKKSVPYNDEIPSSLPSISNVLYYTLLLPIMIIVMYGKSFEQGQGQPVTNVNVMSGVNNGIPPPSDVVSNNDRNVVASQQIKADGSTIASSITDTMSRDSSIQFNSSQFDESTAAFLKEWNYILTHHVRRYVDYLPQLREWDKNVRELRSKVASNPDDWESMYNLVSILRSVDVRYSNGGSDKDEIFVVGKHLLKVLRNIIDKSNEGDENFEVQQVLCLAEDVIGSTEFMADKFLDSVKTYSTLINHGYCNNNILYHAMESRASANIVLGKYEDVVHDALYLIEHDKEHYFSHGIKSLVRILSVKDIDEDIVPRGWEFIISKVDELIPVWRDRLTSSTSVSSKRVASLHLNQLLRAKYHYYEKEKEYAKAFQFLVESNQFKTLQSSVSSKKNLEISRHEKVNHLESVFTPGFFQAFKVAGSASKVPIFIVGSPRSGSTLLESILDAHPQIAGLSEDSVANGFMHKVRDQIDMAIKTGEMSNVLRTVVNLAEEIEKGMFERWERRVSDSFYDGDIKAQKRPLRLVDKQLTNIHNVGFLHILFPNAVIFHVSREPMDCIFSNYKHDFLGSTLDDTDNFATIDDWYKGYRDTAKLWDKVLPGRVFHIRYEEMVHDFENIARAVISAIELPWDDKILEFHSRKQATNTYSSTQVKGKVYTGSIHSWKKYENELRSILLNLDHYAANDETTKLPGYSYDGPQW